MEKKWERKEKTILKKWFHIYMCVIEWWLNVVVLGFIYIFTSKLWLLRFFPQTSRMHKWCPFYKLDIIFIVININDYNINELCRKM